MKTLNWKVIIAVMVAVPLLLLSSCKKDDDGTDPTDETSEFLPVKGENFDFTVNGNDVVFTTDITGNVWVTVNNADHTFVDQTVTVSLPNAGTYSFTCSSLGSGEILTSAPFEVVIDQDNLEFLNKGLWKHLSGGANETKTWRMDMTADAELAYFGGPMYFSGFEDASERLPYWAWDVLPEELPFTINGIEQTTFFNWQPDYAGNTWIMAPGNYGTITFDGTNGTVTATNIEGQESSGTFTFDSATWKLGLSGVILPIDTGRLNEGQQGQFKEEDLANVRIFTLTDSAMQIGIKRSFEGLAEDGSQNVSEWVNVYNFVVVGYDYPEEPDPVQPILTSFTQDDLVGTWKYAAVPFDWIGWVPQAPLNNWATPADMMAPGLEWLGMTQEFLDAAADDEFVFNSDGTCSLNGITNTYTVSEGVITFGTALTASTEFVIGGHWFTVSGDVLNVLDVQGAAVEGGIWVGIRNGTTFESSAFHLIKQ